MLKPSGVLQWYAYIHAHAVFAGDQRTIGEARILERVRNDERLVSLDRMSAEGNVARGLNRIGALPRLEPLPVPIDEGDDGGRHAEGEPHQARDAVEGFLGRGIEDVVSVKRRDALVFPVDHTFGHGHAALM